MLAVAVQLPVVVLADDASGAAAIASSAQMADAATLVLTITPLRLTSIDEASVSGNHCARHYKTLNDPSDTGTGAGSDSGGRAVASYPATASRASPNGLPSESLQIAHASPG
jgi:hypothetical protein